eukprot:COSAG02_NODE_8521_length_2539_cov_1.111066_2_plen_70_part_00
MCSHFENINCRPLLAIQNRREKQAEATAQAKREEDLRRVKAEIREMKQQLHGQARGAKGGLGTGANVPI